MKKILIVDDAEDLRDIVEIIFKDNGYEVEQASNGIECLKKVQEKKFDIILMDVRMPEMDGWETIKKMKEKNLIQDTKIIMLTVEKGPGVEIFGIQDSVIDYVTKPFESDELIKRVDSILNSK